VKVGDLLRKRSTGQLCLLAELPEQKFAGRWIKVFIEGECTKWTPASRYEKVQKSS